jgi:hypothetical protein
MLGAMPAKRYFGETPREGTRRFDSPRPVRVRPRGNAVTLTQYETSPSEKEWKAGTGSFASRVKVRLEPAPPGQPPKATYISLEVPDGITPALLRDFGWARAIRIADATLTGDQGALRTAVDALEQPHAGRQTGDDLYREIAAQYTELRRQGIANPTTTLAAERNVSRNTAASWVRRARQRGHLPPPRRGQAG